VSENGGEVRVHPVGVFEHPGEAEEGEGRPPILLLRDEIGREFQLPIGSCEGLAIHIALTQQQISRPLTHDLALRLLEKLSGKLERVVIDMYSEQGCHATLSLGTPQGAQRVEARAGDGVALALRAELPIFITEEVLARANRPGELPG
jgi:bifunctional DNase/RNase